jgi:hypothetical protein
MVTKIVGTEPRYEDGCVLYGGYSPCSGKVTQCPTCRMVYCQPHFDRPVHMEYCEARNKIDEEVNVGHIKL